MQFEEINAGKRPAPTTPPPRAATPSATATPLERIADLADLLITVIHAMVAESPDIPANVKAEILKGRK